MAIAVREALHDLLVFNVRMRRLSCVSRCLSYALADLWCCKTIVLDLCSSPCASDFLSRLHYAVMLTVGEHFLLNILNRSK